MKNLLKLLEDSCNERKCLWCGFSMDTIQTINNIHIKGLDCNHCGLAFDFEHPCLFEDLSFNNVCAIGIANTEDIDYYRWDTSLYLKKENGNWKMELYFYGQLELIDTSRLDFYCVEDLRVYFKSLELFK